LLRVGAAVVSDLRKPCFLLRGEVYFHATNVGGVGIRCQLGKTRMASTPLPHREVVFAPKGFVYAGTPAIRAIAIALLSRVTPGFSR
jgi:hypothetical protein